MIIHCAPAWLGLVVLFGFWDLGCGAATNPPSAPDLSVEALAALARPSVVVISHLSREGREDGVGAGFIVASNGLIATALHVIGEARPIKVRLPNGRVHEVTEIHAWDRKLDLAVIRIDAGRLPALPLGDSDALKQGAAVVAVGNPLGLAGSIVEGVVSATRELGGVGVLQLAIPVEPGNSGGPLLDRQGRVQGILSSKSALTPNLGFAVPVNALKLLLDKPNPVPLQRWLLFSALNPRQWTNVFGARWRPRAGGLEVEGLGTGSSGRSLCLSRSPVPPPPYELAVRVRLEDESGAAGLVFAADGAERHYGFYPTAGALRLTRFDGPTRDSWTILEQASSPYYRPGDWNDLKVRREKERILCYVNGHLVFESTDSRLPERQVGLAKFRDTRAWFKNFQVGTNLALPSLAPSAEVVAAIEKQLQKLTNTPAGEIVDALRSQAEASQALISARAAKLENEAAQLRRLAVALHEQTVLAELSKALEAPEPQIDLFHAALLISKIDNPELDVASYRRQFDDLARDLVSRLPAKASAADRLAGLTNFFFGESGFHGSRADYDNRANSYLDQVLDDREGLPITLSVLFLELGRRIGLTNLAGVSLPSHFLVRVTTDKGGAQLLDVFDAGRLITRAEAGKVARAHTGEPLRDDQLEAASNREIIIRMVRNLLNLANRTGSNSDSLRYVDAIVALAPESALDRLARASLRLQAGDTAGAKADFQWLFDRKPPGLDLEHVRKLYQALF